MQRILPFIHCGSLLALGAVASPAVGAVLLAPAVQPIGVDATTVAAFEHVLLQEIERQAGIRIVRPDVPASGRACADAECAARRARRAGANAALLCTLAKLGDKYVVTLERVGESARIDWSERRTARREEDLEDVAVQLAAALGARQASSPAAVAGADSGAASERARSGYSRQGPRVGTLAPFGDSFAGAGRMTSLAYVWRYVTPSFDVEVVPALGLTWGGESGVGNGRGRDWSLLDLFIAWTPAQGDIAPYLGAGLGLHALHLEREGDGVPFSGKRSQSETGPMFALGCGLYLFRTYDFQISFDLRYQHFANDFDSLGGTGARGFAMTFGIQHR